ncbi:MAG TPA: hypothetical protein VF331_16315, partial [Polyangiales bacterium]
MIKAGSISLFVLCAALAGCGMRSVLDGYSEPALAAAVDAGAGAAGSGALGKPCGHGGTCDPTNLDGESCQLLGAGGGTLACDPQTCTFDLSMCTGVSPVRTGRSTGNTTGGTAGTGGGTLGGSTGGTGGGTLGGGTGGTGGGQFGGGTAGTGGGTNGGGLFGGGTAGT